MASARSPHPTLYEILSTVQREKSSTRVATYGLNIKPFQHREGTYFLTPEQLLSVRVPIQKITDGRIAGYQRYIRAKKARQIARYITQTEDYEKVMPSVEISIDGKGNAFFTDGQHRAAGAVMAGKQFKVLVTRRSEEQARRLFANQVRQTRLNKNVLVLDGSGPFEEYVQDAVTGNGDHPWSNLISGSQYGASSTKRKIGAGTAYGLLIIYVGGYAGTMNSDRASHPADKFDREAADELAGLVTCFGDRESNPYAFSATSLRAIAIAAKAVFRDATPAPADRERWMKRMPQFDFGKYSYLKGSRDLAERLVVHWNKQLITERKVSL